MDISYMPTFVDALGLAAAFGPIVVLAALALVDVRALMLLRATRLLKRRMKPGEMRISRDEWSVA